jgi:hypothetical protein
VSSLKYVGKAATANRDLVNKLKTDSSFTDGVSYATLQSKVETAVSPLALTAVVDSADGVLASKTYVDQQDALRMLKTQRGAASGVASLDASGLIPATQLTRVSRTTVKGPYVVTMNSSIAEAYFDTSGQWDQVCGSYTIPAPGAGFGLWRPLIMGRVEVYNTTGRTDVFARVGSTIDIARAAGHNYGSVQPYMSVFIPRSDVTSQTPGGWSDTSSLTINFWVSATFNGSRGGLIANGQHMVSAYAIPI